MPATSVNDMHTLVERGLAAAQKLGATAAKLSTSRATRIGCSFEAGRLKSTDTVESRSFWVEVLVGGRRGTAGGNDPAALEDLVGRAVALAQVGAVAHFDRYPPPADLAPVRTHSDRTAALSRESLIEAARKVTDALKAHDPDLFVEAGASRYEAEGLLGTSGGVRHEWRRTDWGLSGGVQRTRDTDMLFAWSWRGWKDLNEYFDPDYIIREIVRDLRWAERSAEAPTGMTTVFIPPQAVESFLFPLMMAVNGRNVAKGDSPLRGRLGEQVLDPALTIVDNPHLDFSPGAAQSDGDGIPTRVTTIFREGVLESFLYDLDSAGLAGAAPTGNDGCGPHDLEVSPGAQPSAELLAGIEDGLYIKGLIGLGQSNVMNGDLAGNVSLGYRIRHGEVVGRVKNVMLAGNLYDVLRRDVRLSSDCDPLLRLPYMVLEGLNASAA